LPYRAETFDHVLMMTVICFLENPLAVLQESFRVLVYGGELILGFIEKEGRSPCNTGRRKPKAGSSGLPGSSLLMKLPGL